MLQKATKEIKTYKMKYTIKQMLGDRNEKSGASKKEKDEIRERNKHYS